MRTTPALILLLATPASATAQAPPTEMVRPDAEGPPPGRTTPPPPLIVTPPDLVPPVVPARVWRQQVRTLKIKTAVSWTFTVIGLVGLAIPLGLLAACDVEDLRSECPPQRGSIIAAPIFGTLSVAALIPAVIYTDRLAYLQLPERAPRLGLGPSGVVLRF